MAKGTGDGVEMEKFLTAFLLTGNSVLTFDNVVDEFGGDVINRFTTAVTWTSRRLGKTETITVRNSTCCIVTANNARVEGDTVRRSIQIRLVANCERPYERTFDVPDLMKHVKSCQEDLTCAAITILRWHLSRGCPTYATAAHVDSDGNETVVDVRPLGSFEAWGRLVRHAVIGLGLPDPATTADTIRTADEKTLGQKAFVLAWFAFKPDWVGTAKDLIDEIYPEKESDFSQVYSLRHAIENLLGDKHRKDGTPRPVDLGVAIRQLKDKVFNDVSVRGGKHVEAGTQWTLERLTKEDS
jgi:hypothetical protein